MSFVIPPGAAYKHKHRLFLGQRQGTNSCTELSSSYPSRKHLAPLGIRWVLLQGKHQFYLWPGSNPVCISQRTHQGARKTHWSDTCHFGTSYWGKKLSFSCIIYPRQGWPVKILGFWGGWVWATYRSGRSQTSVTHPDSKRNDSVEAGWLAGHLRCPQWQLPPRPVCDPTAFIWGAR